jgi:repressor LexA
MEFKHPAGSHPHRFGFKLIPDNCMVFGMPPNIASPRQLQILQLIKQFLRTHGKPPTRADLARALGLRNRQGIDQHLRALAAKQLLTLEPGIARGIRLLSTTSEPGAPDAARAHTNRHHTLALYGRVAAGVPTLASDNIEDELQIDPTLFRPRADFLLRVHGDSMRDADIHERDMLAVHRNPQVVNGQIVVARLGDEATVKYYRRVGHTLRLEPANPAYAPIVVDLRHQQCVIEGLVVGLIRSGMPLARR